jgi:hypothetical protein
LTKIRRRNRLTSQPNTGFTSSVTSTVPMNSQRRASMPRCMPSASRAGRITISAVSTQKKNKPATRAGPTSSRRMLVKRCRKLFVMACPSIDGVYRKGESKVVKGE